MLNRFWCDLTKYIPRRKILSCWFWVTKQRRVSSTVQRRYISHKRVSASRWRTEGEVWDFQLCPLIATKCCGAILCNSVEQMAHPGRDSKLSWEDTDRHHNCMCGASQFCPPKQPAWHWFRHVWSEWGFCAWWQYTVRICREYFSGYRGRKLHELYSWANSGFGVRLAALIGYSYHALWRCRSYFPILNDYVLF